MTDDEAPAATGAPSESSGENSEDKCTGSQSQPLLEVRGDESTDQSFEFVVEGFVRSAKSSRSMPDYGADLIEAVAHLARDRDGYIEGFASRLRKVRCDPNGVTGLITAIKRKIDGRAIRLISASEIMNRADPRFIIEGVIEERSLAVVYSASGVGKTFVILDWSFCVAGGSPWMGRKVMKGPVVYVGAEGLGGLPKRLRALAEYYQTSEPPADFYVVGEPVNLLDATSVAEAVAAVRELGIAPRLVVLDTYARSMVGGDENSAKDAGIAVSALDQLRADLDTAVIVVHHLGKSGTSERGSGALRGAADTMILLEKGKSGLLTLTIDKQKNFEGAEPMALRLQPVGDSVVPVDATTQANAEMWMKAAHASDHAVESMRTDVLLALEKAQAAGLTPITQTKLLSDVRGNARAKAAALNDLLADPASRVLMEEMGNKHLISFDPESVSTSPPL